MRILVVSTCIFPVSAENRYAGIETLVRLISNELNGRGHKVSLVAPEGSQVPEGMEHIDTGPGGDFVESERKALHHYESRLPEFDAVLDFSHSHWCMMEDDLPAIAFIWHDPYIMKPQEPGYNICALSQWQALRFKQVYGYEARVLDPHCGPSGQPEPANGRYLFIGRMGPNKGCIEAIEMCHELGAPLDIIGSLGPGDPPEYLERVKAGCHSGVIYHGAVDEATKLGFLKRSKALIYPLNYPPGAGEGHSHKIVDAQLHGLPVITYKSGAFPEIIEPNVTGCLASDRDDFKRLMMRDWDMLDRELIRERAIRRWGVSAATSRILKVVRSVADGERWGRARGSPAIKEPPAPSAASIRYQLHQYPRQIRLDTINRCNASCICCHYRFQKRPRGRMSMELLAKVLDEVRSWQKPLEEIVPVNFGELFLLKNWYEILKLMEEKLPRTRIALPTNGSFLDDDAVRKLASVKTLKWVNFSINAFFKETYEAFTGLGAETIGKIRGAAETLRLLRPDIITCASMVFSAGQTEIERDMFIKFWQPLVSIVSINPAAYCNSPLKQPPIPVITACRSIFDGLTILHDGRVITGCCFDSNGELAIGDANTQSLLEIWRGDKLMELCEFHNQGKRIEIPLCRSCTFA